MKKKHGVAIGGLILTVIFAIGYLLGVPQPKNIPEPITTAEVNTVAASRETGDKVSPIVQADTGSAADSSTETVVGAALEESTEANAENQNYFLGRWCNNNLGKDSSEFFSLEFLVADDGGTTAVFHNGGPFSENLSVDLSESGAELYFESVDGSMSLNELAGNKDPAACRQRVASGKIIDQNNLEMENINDICGYMSAPAKALLLTRLTDGETCNPN